MMAERRVRFFPRETSHRPAYMVVTLSSGEEASGQLRETTSDPVVLSLMLGGQIDVLSLLEAARWHRPRP